MACSTEKVDVTTCRTICKRQVQELNETIQQRRSISYLEIGRKGMKSTARTASDDSRTHPLPRLSQTFHIQRSPHLQQIEKQASLHDAH